MSSVSAELRDGVLTLEFPQYILDLAVHGDSQAPVCLVHLQAPAGPSSTAPLSKTEVAQAVANETFVVPVPCGPHDVQFFPVKQHYLAMTMNHEAEEQARFLWTGPSGDLALLHRQEPPEEPGMVRLTALRLSLAKVLASMPHLHPDARILVAVSKTFQNHEIRFVNAVPEDDQYLEITQCRNVDSVSDKHWGLKVQVPKKQAADFRQELEGAGLCVEEIRRTDSW